MEPNQQSLSLKKILVFWLPLASTWIMMSLEGPLLSSLISRLPDPKFNLAAYGVVFSLALIFESPIIMMMSASTSLVKDYNSFLKLRNFNYWFIGFTTSLLIIFLIPSVFDFLILDLIKLNREIAKLTYKSMIIFIFWPGLIGYRRFYQGILIRNALTKLVALGTLVRIFSMAITAFLLFAYSNLDGVVIGSFALISGVFTEAVASRFMVNGTLKKIKLFHNSSEMLSYKDIFLFYYPLALTSFITLAVQPVGTFFLSISREALNSLAVLPVINSFVFIFRSIGVSFQEVAIALLAECNEYYGKIKKFVFSLSLILAAIIFIIVLTPIYNMIFQGIFGLKSELVSFAFLPLLIYSIMPTLSVIISFQRAVLVNYKNTNPITIATIIEFVLIIITLYVLIKTIPLIGAIAATTAFVIGRLGANAYLIISVKKQTIKL